MRFGGSCRHTRTHALMCRTKGGPRASGDTIGCVKRYNQSLICGLVIMVLRSSLPHARIQGHDAGKLSSTNRILGKFDCREVALMNEFCFCRRIYCSASTRHCNNIQDLRSTFSPHRTEHSRDGAIVDSGQRVCLAGAGGGCSCVKWHSSLSFRLPLVTLRWATLRSTMFGWSACSTTAFSSQMCRFSLSATSVCLLVSLYA